MATLRKGNTATLFDNVTDGTSAVLEISDSVGSLTLYGIWPFGSTGTIIIETAPTEAYDGDWHLLATVMSNTNTGDSTVAFAPGQVLFVRGRIVASGGPMSALLVAR